MDATDAGEHQRSVVALRRYAERVTTEADPGESRVYGLARSVIVEWRQARVRREQASTKLERLRADERLLVVEIELLDDHRLTLPPAERAWGRDPAAVGTAGARPGAGDPGAVGSA